MKGLSLIAAAAIFCAPLALGAQAVRAAPVFTHADTIRGSNTPQRAWWDVAFYDLHVKVNPGDSSITGYNAITYRVLKPAPGREMQIDLQMPLVVDSIVQEGLELSARRDGNAFFVTLIAPQRRGAKKTISVYYHGKPTVATHAPWDGGFVWARDSLARDWVVTANEGLGASVWWPNKDIYSDEPDSQRVAITVPNSLFDVSNGRLRGTTPNGDGTTTYEWFVRNPINNYDIAVNAGDYAHFGDVYQGEKGKLTLDFYPLDYHLDTAKKQFQQVKPMLQCFESWFGPFPWYEDGYKLVETPHLGMEHQSAVAYGNHYKNGYLGRDRSATGHGLLWDFIIIHESAHEWFGNSITMKDPADMWIHEGFATYAEGLYTECQQGKKAGAEYTIGPDHIEIASFIGLGAITAGEIVIENCRPTDLIAVMPAFRRLGIAMEIEGTEIRVLDRQDLVIEDDIGGVIPKIDDGPWPAFPADLTSIAVAVATQARGTVMIFEKMFENRLFFVDKLVGLGARIILCDPHRVVVTGPARLYGERMSSPDIRAGMAMLLAALCAEGTSTIGNVREIDRGYERIDERLRALGASIERVDG